MYITDNDKLEKGVVYRFNYQIKSPLISLKPIDILRQELADKIKNELEISGFIKVSTYVYSSEIHAIGVYSPVENPIYNPNPDYITFAFPVILIGVIVVAISSLILALSFSIVGHTVEKMSSLPPNINFIFVGILVIVILSFIFFHKRK